MTKVNEAALAAAYELAQTKVDVDICAASEAALRDGGLISAARDLTLDNIRNAQETALDRAVDYLIAQHLAAGDQDCDTITPRVEDFVVRQSFRCPPGMPAEVWTEVAADFAAYLNVVRNRVLFRVLSELPWEPAVLKPQSFLHRAWALLGLMRR